MSLNKLTSYNLQNHRYFANFDVKKKILTGLEKRLEKL